MTDFVTSRDVTEPIKPVRWRFGLRALALRGGSSIILAADRRPKILRVFDVITQLKNDTESDFYHFTAYTNEFEIEVGPRLI